MRKTIFAFATVIAFATMSAFADPVRDWHDLEKVHDHVVESIHEMERARAANHYDMAGQLRLAIDAAKAAR